MTDKNNIMCKSVFVSYTFKDNELDKDMLLKIKEILENCNVKPYIDIIDNPIFLSKTNLDKETAQDYVHRKLQHSDEVWVVKTKNFRISKWVRHEIKLAKKSRINVRFFPLDFFMNEVSIKRALFS
ncbi:hypothetical protein CXU22_11965 [Akkermansia muciniphila]|uniref:Thoeris protein ThsB TIR-like domain-containing protein n=1 Tax=Akkermansia muciniphila TaxID=239935 RepID=A0A2N8HBT5_9BACT|nr:TIR domain-containing protein [Akkermansia muciniphila]PNC17320.1 hypothetical protein CXU22_11965 [Akkermansia muciniphila]